MVSCCCYAVAMLLSLVLFCLHQAADKLMFLADRDHLLYTLKECLN